MKKYELTYRTTSMGRYTKRFFTKNGASRFVSILCPIVYYQLNKNGLPIQQEIMQPLTFFDELQQDGITLIDNCMIHSKQEEVLK